MSSINNVRNLRIFFFSKKNENIRIPKNGEKKWPDIGSYTYYSSMWNSKVYYQDPLTNLITLNF